jgi:energy-coupling factor transport system substrate-specific component
MMRSIRVKKLKVQDLIAVGVYTAIYFLTISICLLVLRFVVPGFHNLFIPAVSALFSGVIYRLVLQRIPRMGAITIMGSVVALFFLMTGHFPLAIVPGILCSFLADVIQYKTHLPKKVRTVTSYIVFSYGLMGPLLPLWFMKNAYVASLKARGKDQVYIQTVFEHVSTQVFLASMVAVLVGAILGYYLGSYLYTKHFQHNRR